MTKVSPPYDIEVTSLDQGELHASQAHEGPHITPIKADYISDNIGITTTTFTTFLFLILVVAFVSKAKAVLKKWSWLLRTAVMSFVDFFYQFLINAFDGDRKYARLYFPLIVGFFVMIFFANLFGLVIDMIGIIIPSIHYYVRPIFSDLASTLPLALFTVVFSLILAIKHNGWTHTLRAYLFNWSGNSISEKAINVFVGWLHIIGLFSTVASLALRLFGNIFAGIILIAVLLYLGVLATSAIGWVGAFLTIPFWFFELFVSFIQAAVFAMLMIAIFKQSHEAH